MPTTYTPSPVEDTPPVAVRSISYTAPQTGGAVSTPLSQTTAHPVVA